MRSVLFANSPGLRRVKASWGGCKSHGVHDCHRGRWDVYLQCPALTLRLLPGWGGSQDPERHFCADPTAHLGFTGISGVNQACDAPDLAGGD